MTRGEVIGTLDRLDRDFKILLRLARDDEKITVNTEAFASWHKDIESVLFAVCENFK